MSGVTPTILKEWITDRALSIYPQALKAKPWVALEHLVHMEQPSLSSSSCRIIGSLLDTWVYGRLPFQQSNHFTAEVYYLQPPPFKACANVLTCSCSRCVKQRGS